MKIQMFHQLTRDGHHDGKTFIFFCPGCKVDHSFLTERPGGRQPCWAFDGNMHAPTFSPSLLIRGGLGHTGHPEAGHADVCHSFVRSGRIEFLGDCTHELASQTVELPEYPEDGREAPP